VKNEIPFIFGILPVGIHDGFRSHLIGSVKILEADGFTYDYLGLYDFF
jgi:hypothetical protein